MKKLLIFALGLSLLIPAPTFANNQELTLNAESAILYNPVTKEILYEKNADKQLPPASLAKVMTMLVSTEKMKEESRNGDELVTISEKAWRTSTGDSKMFLSVGKEVPLNEIHKGVAIVSGNDASIAIAEHLFGNTDDFVNEMNKVAKGIGMKNTKFSSVNGLSNIHTGDVSTARDLLTLTDYYIHKYPENMEIHGTIDFITPKEYAGGGNDIIQKNQNPLLGTYEGATGLKTGYIGKNYNIIATVKRGKLELIAVILNSSSTSAREQDAIKLLNFGFNQYEKIVKGEENESVKELTVFKSKNARSTKVVLKEEASMVVNIKNLDNIEVKDNLPKYLTGGKETGDKVGTRVITDGKNKVSVDIVLTEDLEESGPIARFFDSIAMWFANTFL